MELYTVERIVGKRERKGGVVQYKVKWLNYDEDDCTWEPLKNLQYVSDMVRLYEEKNSKNQKPNRVERKPIIRAEIIKGDQDQNQGLQNEYFQQQNQLNEQANEQEENEANQQQIQQEEHAAQKSHEKEQKAQPSNWDDDQVPDFDIELESLSLLGQDEEFKTQEQIQHISAPRKLHKNQQIRKIPEKDVQKSKPKKAPQIQKKPYLQQVQERTRFIVKNPPKKKSADQLPRTPKPSELKILQMSRCNKTNQLIYLTQWGEIIAYRRKDDMKRLFPDQLIHFYQNSIEFQKIPKLSKIM